MNKRNLKTLINSTSKLILLLFIIGCNSEDEGVILEDPGDIIAPVLTFITPTNNSIQTESFDVSINATDNVSIEEVELYINNVLIGFDSNFPFEFTININEYLAGSYTLKGVAYDSSNNTSLDEISVTIAKSSMDAPLNLIASKGDYGNKINIGWNPVPNAQNYKVFKLSDVTNEYEFIGETSNNNFEDNNISLASTQYFYKVMVSNSQTEFSEFSNIDYGYTNGDNYDVLLTFGSEGSNDGQFLFNQHVSIDTFDNIYVSDPNGNKIEKFNSNGQYLQRFQTISSPRGIHFLNNGNVVITKSENNKVAVLDQSNNVINEWGSYGNGNGQFYYFRQICTDTDENIFIVDHNNHRIQKFNNQGNFITKWGQNGPNEGDFDYPWGIAVLNNQVMVSDQNGIQVFDLNGNFIKKIIIPYAPSIYDIAVKDDKIFLACGYVVLKTDIDFEVIERIKEGYFTTATGITVDSNNNLIVCDTSQRTITILNEN